MTSLLCSSFLAVLHLPQYQSLECLSQALEDPDTTELAYEDGRAHLSLLQSSFYVGSAEAHRKHFRLPPTEKEIAMVANQLLHWSGDAAKISSLQSQEVLRHQDPKLSRSGWIDEDAQASPPRLALSMYSSIAQEKQSGLSILEVLAIVLTIATAIGLFVFLLVWAEGARVSSVLFSSKSSLADRLQAAVRDPSGFLKSNNRFLSSSRGLESMHQLDWTLNRGTVQEVASLPPVELDGDTFGMSVYSLTRDAYFVSVQGASFGRAVRMAASIILVLLTISIQLFLLVEVKQFVCARAVHDIRTVYDKYSLAIYGAENTTLDINWNHRGIPGTMPALAEAMVRLNGMKEADRDEACRIPLSQPFFFGVILLIWTLACIAELRKAWNLQLSIVMLETVPSMSQAIIKGSEEDADGVGVIHGMTMPMKCLTTLIIFIPRVGATIYLLYVGGQWLLATTQFSEWIMDAIALVFILLVKDVLYLAIMPACSSLDLKSTLIEPFPKKLTPTWFNFASSFLLLVMATLWVCLYMRHWQAVLPEYRWDVHDVCIQYIKDRYAV